MNSHILLCSDNQAALREMPENSLDACITDPPYGMEIAGVGWDHNVPPVETWKEVYRVLKPGAFVLSFCAPEFYHRMAVAVEDAGFRPLDMVVWIVTTKMAKANRLKPAHEPIFVAQKPLDGTLIKNVEKHGCGKINIEDSRIPWDKKPPTGWIKGGSKRRAFGSAVEKAADYEVKEKEDANPNGRYPSDIIGHFDEPEHQKYFYAPRATRKERGEYNDHPTPKPIALMRYLCRVYCPKGGIIVDPFMGSGSTGIGALQEGMDFIGIDMNQHYVDISEKRIHDYCFSDEPVDKLFSYEDNKKVDAIEQV
jgi:site-specific DNA-methyltransferase (adenine-specific)